MRSKDFLALSPWVRRVTTMAIKTMAFPGHAECVYNGSRNSRGGFNQRPFRPPLRVKSIRVSSKEIDASIQYRNTGSTVRWYIHTCEESNARPVAAHCEQIKPSSTPANGTSARTQRLTTPPPTPPRHLPNGAARQCRPQNPGRTLRASCQIWQ